MARYFIEVAYKGSAYAGFQVQQNANTIQAEVEKALSTYFRVTFELTGSSRTDAGVHAAQNFFHTDVDLILSDQAAAKAAYHLNAILPGDIVISGIHRVADTAHARFDALSRSYEYILYSHKDPFLDDKAYYYPYALDLNILNEAAAMCMACTNFKSFSKKNTQVFTHECMLTESRWYYEGKLLKFSVTGNRFLRGMVRGLVGTMLHAGRGKYSVEEFKNILERKDASLTDFSVPAKGLFLRGVNYPPDIFINLAGN